MSANIFSQSVACLLFCNISFRNISFKFWQIQSYWFLFFSSVCFLCPILEIFSKFWVTVHRVAKSGTQLSKHTHTLTHTYRHTQASPIFPAPFVEKISFPLWILHWCPRADITKLQSGWLKTQKLTFF